MSTYSRRFPCPFLGHMISMLEEDRSNVTLLNTLTSIEVNETSTGSGMLYFNLLKHKGVGFGDAELEKQIENILEKNDEKEFKIRFLDVFVKIPKKNYNQTTTILLGMIELAELQFSNGALFYESLKDTKKLINIDNDLLESIEKILKGIKNKN